MNTGRHRYLVAYDIRDPKRLRLVFKAMKGYGEHLQFSVFLCDLRKAEKSAMQMHLGELIHLRQDSVAIVDLGLADERGRICVEFMGVHSLLPVAGPTIV